MTRLIDQIKVGYVQDAYYEILSDIMGHEAIVRRLDRAFDMITKDRSYTFDVVSVTNPMIFTVKSPNDTYTVIPSTQSCSCPDAESLCKHRLAIKLVLLAIRKQTETVQGYL